ncbi:MAG: hypothetical protein AB8B53_08395 [Flavobacteriales bacterium]
MSKNKHLEKVSSEENMINWSPIKWGAYSVLSIYFAYFIYFYSNYSIKDGEIGLGEFGDYFGALNTLFTVAAFIAAAIAIYMQSHELKLSRKAIILQTKELKDQKEEMSLNRLEFETNRITDIVLKQIDRVNTVWASCMEEHENTLNRAKTQRKKSPHSNEVLYESSTYQIIQYFKNEENRFTMQFNVAEYFMIIYPAITSLSVAAYMVKDYDDLIYKFRDSLENNKSSNELKNSLPVVIRENLPIEFVKLLNSIDLTTFERKEKVMKIEGLMNEPIPFPNDGSHELFYEIESYLVVIDHFIGLKYDKGVRELAGNIGVNTLMKFHREEKSLNEQIDVLGSSVLIDQAQLDMLNSRLNDNKYIQSLNNKSAYFTITKITD